MAGMEWHGMMAWHRIWHGSLGMMAAGHRRGMARTCKSNLYMEPSSVFLPSTRPVLESLLPADPSNAPRMCSHDTGHQQPR